jgi:hypothetical protein
MSKLNGGSVTLGWDSIDSSVDAFDLQERHYDTVDAMARPAQPSDEAVDRLDDIISIATRARRDAREMSRICAKYNLNDSGDFDRATHKIANQTLETVSHVSGGRPHRCA